MSWSKNNLPHCHPPISDEWDDGNKDGRSVSGRFMSLELSIVEGRCIQMTFIHNVSANEWDIRTKMCLFFLVQCKQNLSDF